MSDIELTGDVSGYEEITVGTAVQTLTGTAYAPSGALRANGAMITGLTAGVRWRCDGGSPGTAAPWGHPMGTADTLVISGANNLSNFKVVAEGTVSATLLVTYFR